MSSIVLMLTCAALPRPAPAQEMDLPVSVQVPLFLKVIAFDRQRNQQADAVLVVGVAYQNGFRLSVTTRDQVARALSGEATRKIRVVAIDLDRDDLNVLLQQHRITFLYVAPLRGYSIADIAGAAAVARAITVTGVPEYVEQGLSISARLQGERPKLLVNLGASRKSGADFSAELLKLVQVVP